MLPRKAPVAWPVLSSVDCDRSPSAAPSWHQSCMQNDSRSVHSRTNTCVRRHDTTQTQASAHACVRAHTKNTHARARTRTQAHARTHLVAARAEPAAGCEVQLALGARGHIEELEVAVAVNPGASHDHIVRLAVGRHEGKHLPCLPELNARPTCPPNHASSIFHMGMAVARAHEQLPPCVQGAYTG